MYSVLAILFLFNGWATSSPTVLSRSKRIVGGQSTTIEEYPYQVAVLHFEIHKCGGAIINPSAVLTAAHCTDGIYLPKFEVRAGSTYRGRGGIVIPVRRYHQHPSYSKKLIIDYDISVVMLRTPLEFSPQIQAIPLPQQDEEVPIGAIGVSSGWGRLSEGGDVPLLLQYVSVPIVNMTNCTESYGYKLNDKMLCAGYSEGGRDACKQDSGGPLAVEEKLVGIISWAIGCGRSQFPGIYTRVSAFRDWIDFVIEL